MVLGVCRRILRNEADAEDAFQATFLVLVRKASSIRPRGMVSNWLYGVAHNTALKAKAMNHKRRLKEVEAGTMPKQESAREAWSQVQTVVDAELSRLPDKYRVPIILCDLEGKTIKEAMHHLGWPQGTVASRLTRGRALLARRLTKHGVTLSAGMLAGALMEGAAAASVPAALTANTVHAAALFALGKTAAASGVSAAALALTDGMLKTMLLVKLKVATAALLVVAALTTGIGAVAYYGADSDAANTQALATQHAVPVMPARSEVKADPVAPATDVVVPQPPEKEAPDDEPKFAAKPPRFAPPDDIRVYKVIIVRNSSGCCEVGAAQATKGHTTAVQVEIKTSSRPGTPTRIEIQRAVHDALSKGNAYVIDLSGVHTQKLIVPALKAAPGGAVLNALPADRLWVIVNKGQCQVIHTRPGNIVSTPMEPATYYNSVGPLAP